MAVAENAIYYLEIITKEVQAVADYYSNVHGWHFDAEAPELGNARVAALPDGSLCGIRAPMHDQETPTTRPYLRVADLDRAVREAAGRGATVAIESMEIAGRGTIAIVLLGGVEQGLWQLP